jgi:hypothetical protein
MTFEEGWEQRKKCPCGHLWIVDHIVSGDRAPCRFCSCVMDMWEVGTLEERTLEQLSDDERRVLDQLIKEGGK